MPKSDKPVIELSDDVKRFIVMRLACWDTPSEVAKQVKDEYGITVSRQRVHVYNPTKKSGSGLSEEFRVLFDETRAKFLNDTSEIGISHKSVRLKMLDRAARVAASKGDLEALGDMIERAAKEMGGSYTNKRELSGPDGAPIKVGIGVLQMTDEDLELIARGSSKRIAPPPKGEKEPA